MDKSKQKTVKRTALIVLLSYILYTTLTTDGALRFAVMIRSNPIDAYTTGFRSTKSSMGDEILYTPTKSITGPPPVYQTILYFKIENAGPFKIATYIGLD